MISKTDLAAIVSAFTSLQGLKIQSSICQSPCTLKEANGNIKHFFVLTGALQVFKLQLKWAASDLLFVFFAQPNATVP